MTARPRRATPGEPRRPPIRSHDGEHGHGHDRGDGHDAGHDHGHGGGGSPGAAWDERFSASGWPEDPDEPLVGLVGPLEPGRAIDLGCGPGRNAIWLARQGWAVTGVDASAVGLAQATERAEREGLVLELVQADLLSYVPAKEGFDLVVVANVHLAPADRGPFLARAVAAVSPGGHLFVSGHHLDSFGRAGPPFPERLYTEELLAGLLAPLAARVRRHERPAGEAGSLPLVDVVAWAKAPGGSGGGR